MGSKPKNWVISGPAVIHAQIDQILRDFAHIMHTGEAGKLLRRNLLRLLGPGRRKRAHGAHGHHADRAGRRGFQKIPAGKLLTYIDSSDQA